MKNTFTILLLAAVQFMVGQQLFPEMEINSLATNEGDVILNDGTVISGQLGLATMQTSSGLQRINSIRVYEGGETKKFKVKDVKEIRIKADWNDANLQESGDGIQWFTEMKADQYIFKRILDKKGKPRLLQLLNPGFDNEIQVYVDPKSKDSSFASMVGKDTAKSYYFTKGDGSAGMYVKKSKYKKSFSTIYDGCPDILTEYGGNPKWGDLAKHVYHYDQHCE